MALVHKSKKGDESTQYGLKLGKFMRRPDNFEAYRDGSYG
jgi:hypothetical protein